MTEDMTRDELVARAQHALEQLTEKEAEQVISAARKADRKTSRQKQLQRCCNTSAAHPSNTYSPKSKRERTIMHPIHDHVRLADVVADVGVQPPKPWRDLHERFTNYLALQAQTPMLDKLTTAVVTGGKGDVAELRALAMGEELSASGGRVAEHIHYAVYARLRELYDGADAYQAVAAMFNEAVKHLIEAAVIADLEAKADAMLFEDDEVRQAYKSGEAFSNAIDRLLPAMAAAASLPPAATSATATTCSCCRCVAISTAFQNEPRGQRGTPAPPTPDADAGMRSTKPAFRYTPSKT
jgi:hypothetical protein